MALPHVTLQVNSRILLDVYVKKGNESFRKTIWIFMGRTSSSSNNSFSTATNLPTLQVMREWLLFRRLLFSFLFPKPTTIYKEKYMSIEWCILPKVDCTQAYLFAGFFRLSPPRMTLTAMSVLLFAKASKAGWHDVWSAPARKAKVEYRLFGNVLAICTQVGVHSSPRFLGSAARLVSLKFWINLPLFLKANHQKSFPTIAPESVR